MFSDEFLGQASLSTELLMSAKGDAEAKVFELELGPGTKTLSAKQVQ